MFHVHTMVKKPEAKTYIWFHRQYIVVQTEKKLRGCRIAYASHMQEKEIK